MKSLKELRELRETLQKKFQQGTVPVNQRLSSVWVPVVLPLAPVRILHTVLEEIERRKLDVVVTQTGCIGMCEKEPLLDVQLPGKERITYGNLKKMMSRGLSWNM